MPGRSGVTSETKAAQPAIDPWTESLGY